MYELSPEAAADIADLVDYSIGQFGAVTARRTLVRLERKFTAIGAGRISGHVRPDISAAIPLRFENEPPYVIGFDPESRRIVRILHAARDLPRLLSKAP